MSFAVDIPIELTVMPDPGDSWRFRVYWPDGDQQLGDIPDVWLDLVPFMAARILLSHGYDAERPYIVRLQGADREMMRTDLGSAAATPLVNLAAPVHRATHCIYRKGDRERKHQRQLAKRREQRRNLAARKRFFARLHGKVV